MPIAFLTFSIRHSYEKKATPPQAKKLRGSFFLHAHTAGSPVVPRPLSAQRSGRPCWSLWHPALPLVLPQVAYARLHPRRGGRQPSLSAVHHAQERHSRDGRLRARRRDRLTKNSSSLPVLVGMIFVLKRRVFPIHKGFSLFFLNRPFLVILVNNIGQNRYFLQKLSAIHKFSPYLCSAFKIKTSGPLSDQM